MILAFVAKDFKAFRSLSVMFELCREGLFSKLLTSFFIAERYEVRCCGGSLEGLK